MTTKIERRIKIKYRVRNKVSGTTECPRMSVFRSNKQIYVQIIDDLSGKTLAAASSLGLTEKGDNIDTWTGMRLAGVDGAVVHERDELKRELDKVLADKSIGIILLTEKFGREFPEIIDNVKLERKLPLIVEIPDRHGTGRKPDFITSYVNEAIGLKL